MSTHDTRHDGGLTVEQAEGIWAILTEVCGATTDHGFVHHQTHEHVIEWRFIGSLGFGGKFYRTTSRRPDDTWGELWFVTCYSEDETPARLATIKAANQRLWEFQQATTETDTEDNRA